MPDPVLSIDAARGLVEQNKAIADVGVLRDAFFASAESSLKPVTDSLQIPVSEGPAFLYSANRRQNLQQYSHFVDSLLTGELTNPAMTQVCTLLREAVFDNEQLVAQRPFTQAARPEFNTIDPIDTVFATILKEPELRFAWLKTLDERVTAISATNLRKMDLASAEQDKYGEAKVVPPLRKEIVIVGDGPLAALATSILGPFYRVTVITEQKRLAGKWRNRPIFINSSTEFDDVNGPRLPLLAGSTTPITALGQVNHIYPGEVADASSYEVECDDGTTRRYISGPLFGATIATNTAFDTDDFIVDQQVLFDQITVNVDGSKRIKIVDKETGELREFDADVVLTLTGPGEEVCTATNPASQKIYEVARATLRDDIRSKRLRMQFIRDELKRPPQELTRVIRATLERELQQISITVPDVLNLSMLEEAYDFWFNDLERDPKRFPLRALFSSLSIIVGGGDTAKTLYEFLRMQGPQECYPDDLDVPTEDYVQVFGLNDESGIRQRRRYKRVKPDITNAERVFSFIKNDYEVGPNVEVAILNDRSLIEVETGDYLLLANGFRRRPIESQLAFPVEFIADDNDNTCGRGNSTLDFYILGSASGLPTERFPVEIRDILKQLGIPENTLSLWVYGNLTESFLWSLARRRGINEGKIQELIDFAIQE